MHIYGLTGGISSGKTTVSRYLETLGCPIIDADIIARQIVEPDRPAWRVLIGTFGVEICNDDRTINRTMLGQIVFNDEEKRRALNRITHPYIQWTMMGQIVKYFLKGEQFVVLVSPLLYESNKFLNYMKKIIVVNCTEDQQLLRLMSRDNLSKEEAKQRISCQLPLSVKCQRAQYVIDNSSERQFTEQQTYHLYRDMKTTSVYCGLYRWLLIIIILVCVVLTALYF